MSSCRFCGASLTHVFIDLGESPVANSFLTKEQLSIPEEKYPLKVFVCGKCFLVQLEEFKKARDIFKEDYAYFSSYSTTWLTHAKNYCEKVVTQFQLNSGQLVIEIASNDGYLLQFFREKKIPTLGIEPSANVAQAAQQKGIESIVDYFSSQLANELREKKLMADLLIGNNVLAHVPDINDFVSGMKILLKPDGIITMEFPHLLQLIEQCQFDTIYHEHYSYFSFTVVKTIFEAHDLTLFDVEEIPTHGGSLRIYAKHRDNDKHPVSPHVEALLQKEEHAGMNSTGYYRGFDQRVEKIKNDLLNFLHEQKRLGKTVAAYGAAAKGNTLLNYCGVKSDMIRYVVDRSTFKQGKFLPGSHIPVVPEKEFLVSKPGYILIFPWNIREEIEEQLHYVREWGARFAVAIPELQTW